MPARVKQPKQPSRPAAVTGPSRPTSTAPAAAVRELRTTPKPKSDDFAPLRKAIIASAGPAAEAAAPALLRALYSASSKMGSGEAPEAVAVEAAKLVLSSPEMLASFKHALPALEAAAKTVGGPAAAKAAAAVLPLVANGQTTKAILKLATEVGGAQGRRLAGAALRGLAKGGMASSAAEVAATAAKISAKTTAKGAAGAVGKALGKAAPIVGNAVNILSVGTSLVSLIKSLGDRQSTAGGKLAHVLHLAASVVGCFIPPVGVAGDLAMAGASVAGVK
ncbi:MAG: hypothetical protein HYZ28_22070 [Myxococcales bacterium]|nr:hypothetical protein [Myxococcales bacterium]